MLPLQREALHQRARVPEAPTGQARAARPLDSYETILKYLRTTRTATGLRVRAHLVRKTYKTGVKVTDAQMRELRITPDSSMPKWNYTIERMKRKNGCYSLRRCLRFPVDGFKGNI